MQVLNTYHGFADYADFAGTPSPRLPGRRKKGLGGDLGHVLPRQISGIPGADHVDLSVPIRNRVAQADSARAHAYPAARRGEVSASAEQRVAVDVHNAQVTLQQDRAAVIAAQKAADLQKETLDADEKRLAAGAGTNFVVVTDQQTSCRSGERAGKS